MKALTCGFFVIKRKKQAFGMNNNMASSETQTSSTQNQAS